VTTVTVAGEAVEAGEAEEVGEAVEAAEIVEHADTAATVSTYPSLLASVSLSSTAPSVLTVSPIAVSTTVVLN